MGSKSEYVLGCSYIDKVEKLYKEIVPASYRDEVRKAFQGYSLYWQYCALTLEDKYIIRNKPSITPRMLDKIDFNINRRNVAFLLTYSDPSYAIERLCGNFGKNILDNPKIYEFNQSVLEILLNIENYDAFDKLAHLGFEIDEETQRKLVRIYSRYSNLRKEKAKAVVRKYLTDDDLAEKLSNLR